MLNWKEPSIYFESITKVRLLRFHTHTRIPSQPRCVTESTESVLDVVTSKKTKLNRSPSQPRESNFCDTFENHVTLNSFISQKESLKSSLHRKRQNWTVPHPNRLNRFPSEQRTTRRCYIEKDKTDPFHIPTDWTVSHLSRELDVVTSKKAKLNRSTPQQTEPSQAGCVIESTRLLRNAQLKRAINLFRKYHKS